MQEDLRNGAQSLNETTMVDALLQELEKVSRCAHEKVGFTYMPLEKMAALQ